MIKRLLNQYLRTILSELFLNADTLTKPQGTDSAGHGDFIDSLSSSYSSSNAPRENLIFRPDVFDISLYPIKLFSGSLGRVIIDGVAEAALGGSLRIRLENLYLLFIVDDQCNPEYVHVLRKMLIESCSKNIAGDTLENIHALFIMLSQRIWIELAFVLWLMSSCIQILLFVRWFTSC